MVSVVPSIIPILTANAVAANQVKRKNKSLNNNEKKLKNSPLNNKINCRVFLNNGNVIEGHYEGNWYEDNSDEEGIWIKTDNGTEEINSKDYDRVEYYHKKPLKEAYIKGENGNVYYTKNSDMFLSMVKSIFISKNIPVRVYFDTIKQLYVFGDAFGYIHADLATSMKYYSKIYGADEMRANVSYLKQNCALFQVLPDDNFKEYDVGDGYTKGRFLILDDLIFACREKEYTKVRDNVPLFKDHIGEWIPTDYYIAKKQGLTESIKPMHINSSVKLITTDAECANWIKNNPNNRLLYDVDKKWYIVSNDIEDDIHIYMIEDAIRDGYYPEFAEKYKDRLNHDMMGEVGIEIINKNQDRFLLLRGLTKDNEELMSDGYQDKYDCGDFYMFSIKNEFEKIPVYKYFKSKLIESKELNESVEDKIIFEPTDDTFVIGGKEFQDEGCDVYYIIINNTKVGMLALKKLYNGNIEIAGLEFGEPYRNKGYGKQVVKILKEKYGKIYVRAIPNAKGFWDKQGHKSSWNDDSGTFDGMLDESVQNDTDEKLNSKTNCKIVLKDGKTIYGHLLSVNENYVYINSNNGNRIKKDDIKELYMYYDCEVILKDGKTIYGNFIGDFGDHKLHLDDSFNRKGWAIKDEMIDKVNYKKVIKHTFDTDTLNESVEDKILYIIRGVPGSGKSTLAHKLTDNVVEADQYFYDDKGNYNWSADKLNQAHNWCFYTVKKYMEEGRDKIAVANTFVKNRDYKRYVELAKEFGYKVDIRTCTGNYQNIHNVPDETVEKMRSKFQETPLDESAENDKTLRDYAVKLANICLDALVKTKYETRISKEQVQIDVDKAFKKAVPMLKNSPYEYFLLLVNEKDEPNPSFGKVDNKYGVIMFPVFSSDPSDLALSLLYKHKSTLNKLYSTYSGDELKLKMHEYATKYLKNEIKKRLENKKNTYLDILIHECTHLLDDVRRTKTYKSKEQELKDDKGIEDYYNSPEEQNAYYQGTVSIFDEYAENKLVGYKTFDIFWDDFIRQYRGEYNMLNDKNKRKLKKRAYAYWYVYMKD